MIYHDQDAMETAYLSGEWVPGDADYPRPDEGLAFAAGWEAARKFYLPTDVELGLVKQVEEP